MNYHRVCGRHSGIPECCIDFFIGQWSNVLHPQVKIRGQYLQMCNPASYIRCPMCILNGKIVKLKRCDCGTEKEN